MATISGLVEDSTGTPCAGVVRAYRALTGAFVGEASADPVTGLYSITTNYAAEPHFVVRHAGSVIAKDDLFSNAILGARLFGQDGGTFFPETYAATNWTAVGTPVLTISNPSFSGKASLSLNGSSQLNYTYTTRQNILANGNNFSIECRFRRGGATIGSLIGHNHLSSYSSYCGWSVHVDASGYVIVRIRDAYSTEQLISSTSAVPLNEWAHVEVSAISNTGYLFINGTLEATVSALIPTAPWAMPTSEPIRIGYTQMFGYFTGQISDVRVTNVGRHSASFTVPSTPSQTYLTYDAPSFNAQVVDYIIPI